MCGGSFPALALAGSHRILSLSSRCKNTMPGFKRWGRKHHSVPWVWFGWYLPPSGRGTGAEVSRGAGRAERCSLLVPPACAPQPLHTPATEPGQCLRCQQTPPAAQLIPMELNPIPMGVHGSSEQRNPLPTGLLLWFSWEQVRGRSVPGQLQVMEATGVCVVHHQC